MSTRAAAAAKGPTGSEDTSRSSSRRDVSSARNRSTRSVGLRAKSNGSAVAIGGEAQEHLVERSMAAATAHTGHGQTPSELRGDRFGVAAHERPAVTRACLHESSGSPDRHGASGCRTDGSRAQRDGPALLADHPVPPGAHERVEVRLQSA